LPDWVAGISIGANAAIIVGNTPENRVKRLRSFWEEVTAQTKSCAVCAGFAHRPSGNKGKVR
jgi:NTE family protein